MKTTNDRPEINCGNSNVEAAVAEMLDCIFDAVGTRKDWYALELFISEAKYAKNKIDAKYENDPDVIAVTTALIEAMLRYIDDNTIPCNEWPSPSEVADQATMEAKRLLTK